MRYPASWWGALWRDAIPLGNGQIGAAVYGGVHAERIMITHEDLWWQAKTPPLPDVSEHLPQVRRLMAAGQVREAERVYSEAFESSGYRPQMAAPLPLGDLRIVMAGQSGFEHYRRTLDMASGQATVSWIDDETSYARRTFVSRTDGLLVCRISRDGPQLIDARICLEPHDPRDVQTFRPPVGQLPDRAEVQVRDEFVLYAATLDDGKTDFGAVARVVTQGGAIAPASGELGVTGRGLPDPLQRLPFKMDHVLSVTGAQQACVYVDVFINEDREQAWPRLMRRLAEVEDEQTLFERHVAAHRKLFAGVDLDLGVSEDDRSRCNEDLLADAYEGQASPAMIEKMWALGRYLLISASHEGGQPCPQMGLWCGEYRGFWTFHMVNENLQMIYAQALSGNLARFMLPVFDYFEKLLADFRTNARNLYGCRGIYVPAPTAADSGLIKFTVPHITHWTGGAGWLGQLIYDYYLHTGDREFLRRRALPWLRETALFYQDFFVLGDDGKYISSPSNSPENPPANQWDGRALCPSLETAINATMDFAIAKEVLTHLIEGSRLLGEADEQELANWRQMQGRIPEYQINEHGGIREWMHPRFEDNEHHRHLSHLYPLYPGLEAASGMDADLREAFAIALRRRHRIGLLESSAWTLMHQAGAFARIGDGDTALRCMDLMSRMCLSHNFFAMHNDWRNMGIGLEHAWAPFQIDANMGWTAAVQEMLLFSVPLPLGEHDRDDATLLINLLPALPKRWTQGSIGPLLARGNVLVKLNWDMNKRHVSATLTSVGRDRTVDLKLPAPVQPIAGLNVKDSQIRNVALPADQPVPLTIQL
ncbi:MAG: glycoside hydrolase N-terminal domain-containing protein [Phycisphaeraceae bacterium]|nr:glycoside hydrolase N-terminal domain-containing protein [Phycisphaeraceae bacterium]